MEKKLHNVNEYINLETIQYIQDNFAKATGLSFVTVDYKGRELTKTSGFEEFCTRGRMQKDFSSLCGLCDAHGGLHSAITGQPHMYYCHAGLVDFAVPLIVDGNYLGSVMGGQAKLPQSMANKLDFIIPKKASWLDDPLMRKYYDNVDVLPLEKIKATVVILNDIIRQLTESTAKNSASNELGKKNLELLEEKARRRRLEEEIQQNRDLIVGYETMFDMLNTLSGLGYRDNAPSVCDAVDDIAGILRYSTKGEEISSLEEELKHADRLLKLHSTKLMGNFDYQIDVDKKHFSITCPFMTLRPSVEYAINQSIYETKGLVKILSREQDNVLSISVQSNGKRPTDGNVRPLVQTVDMGKEKYAIKELKDLNNKLKSYYGHRFGLELINHQSSGKGTEIIISIPIG